MPDKAANHTLRRIRDDLLEVVNNARGNLEKGLLDQRDWLSREVHANLGFEKGPGNPRSANHWHVVYVGMLIKLQAARSAAAGARRVFPGDCEELPYLKSQRKTLERAYSKRKDHPSFKYQVELFLDLHSRSSLAGRFDPPLTPLLGALEVLAKAAQQN